MGCKAFRHEVLLLPAAILFATAFAGFRKYGEQYGFDWLLIAAQAYQESGLNPKARSPAGAVGVMQVRRATAKEMGIPNIADVEQNVHAGVKYMAHLRDRYFDDPEITAANQWDFALAGYNAGPARVQKWRKKARASGLDPNRWFANVELIALREIGRETVRYVRNINKYYVAYKLTSDILEKRVRERGKRGSPREEGDPE